MRGEQAELRRREHFWTKLRVDSARFDFRRAEKSLQSIAQYFAPMRECCGDQHAQRAVVADVEARLERRPQPDEGRPDLRPRLKGTRTYIEQLFNLGNGREHDRQSAICLVAGLGGHAI